MAMCHGKVRAQLKKMHQIRLADGYILDDRYKILSKNGEGGFASVYCAFDQVLDRQVALKVMKHPQDEDGRARFLREAKLLSKLSHKNIVSIFAFDLLEEAVPFIAMEYLTGRSLQTMLSECGKLPPKQIMTLLIQCCEGLDYVHKANITHRDLSPANIFLVDGFEDLQVKLIDFGISKAHANSGATGSVATATGFLIGNPPYMSPEACLGQKTDSRGDIYSLGCIIYECLSGKKPFDADSIMGIIYKQQNEYPPPPLSEKDFDDDETRLLADVALRCMQKDPSKRFQSCDDILQYLSNKGSEDKNIDALDGWRGDKSHAHRQSTRRKPGSATLLHKTKQLLKSPTAIASFCLLLLTCGVFTYSFLNSDTGQTQFAKWSLQRDQSKSNLLYWLKKSQSLKSKGKEDAGKAILNELEQSTRGTVALPTIFLELAKAALANGDNKESFDYAFNCVKELREVKVFKTDRENQSEANKVDGLVTEACELILKSKVKLKEEQYALLTRQDESRPTIHLSNLPLRLEAIYASHLRSRSQQLIQILELESLLPKLKTNKNDLYTAYLILSIKYSNLQDSRGWTDEEKALYLQEAHTYAAKEEDYIKKALSCCVMGDEHYTKEIRKCYQHLEYIYWSKPDYEKTREYALKTLAMDAKATKDADIVQVEPPLKFEFLNSLNIPYLCNMHLGQIALIQHDLKSAKKYCLEALKFHAQSNFGWGGEPEAQVCLADIAWELNNKNEAISWMEDFKKQGYSERIDEAEQAINSNPNVQMPKDRAESEYIQALVMSARWYRAHGLNDLCTKSLIEAKKLQDAFPQKVKSIGFYRIAKVLNEMLAETPKTSTAESANTKRKFTTDINLEYRI